jgi:hypothetical protein
VRPEHEEFDTAFRALRILVAGLKPGETFTRAHFCTLANTHFCTVVRNGKLKHGRVWKNQAQRALQWYLKHEGSAILRVGHGVYGRKDDGHQAYTAVAKRVNHAASLLAVDGAITTKQLYAHLWDVPRPAVYRALRYLRDVGWLKQETRGVYRLMLERSARAPSTPQTKEQKTARRTARYLRDCRLLYEGRKAMGRLSRLEKFAERLAKSGQHPDAGGNVRADCPLCQPNHVRGGTFSVQLLGEKRGVYKCHRCEASGYVPLDDSYAVAHGGLAHMNIPTEPLVLPDGCIPWDVAVQAVSAAAVSVVAYARTRASDSSLAAVGAYVDVKRERLVLPVRDKTGRLRTYVTRATPAMVERGFRKYLNAKGANIGDAFFNDSVIDDPEDKRTLVVVEGALDVMPHLRSQEIAVVASLGAVSDPQLYRLASAVAKKRVGLVFMPDADAFDKAKRCKKVLQTTDPTFKVGVAKLQVADFAPDPDEIPTRVLEDLAALSMSTSDGVVSLDMVWQGR